jgi:tRNA modification GTPase
VFDTTVSSFREVMDAVSEFKELTDNPTKKMILIGNKTDLLVELPRGFKGFVETETIFVSAKRKENIHLIAESLLKSVETEKLYSDAIVSNVRHLEALQNALSSIEATHKGLETDVTPDLFTVDIRKALHHLGEITGEITTDEILGSIFSKFCIGK